MRILEALSTELTAAMRRRDTAVVSALRSAQSALANAEATPDAGPRVDGAGAPVHSRHVAGATPGLGATEVARVTLTQDQVRTIVDHERADLLAHAERLQRLCRRDEADGARRAADVLASLLDEPGGRPS